MTRPRPAIPNGAAWLAALAALLLVAAALAACTAPLDQAGARAAATDYYLAFDHEGDNPPVDVIITDAKPATHDGRSGWQVAISGRIVLPGLPEGHPSAMQLFIDGSSRAVTIIGQG